MIEKMENPGVSGQGSGSALDSAQVTTPGLHRQAGNALSDSHRAYLSAQAVDVDLAERLGVRSLLSHADNPQDGTVFERWANFPAILFPWTNENGLVQNQIRPDNPTVAIGGRPRKYVFQKGMTPLLWAVRPIDDDTVRVVFVEGTKQGLAAASYAPAGTAVYSFAGIRMWQKDGRAISDLCVADGMPCIVIPDSDAADNSEVYVAAMEFRDALTAEGARKVTFARLQGGPKDGLDDILAGVTEDRRAAWFARLLDAATKTKPADQKPAAKKGGGSAPTGVEPLDVSNPADAVNWLQGRLGHGKMSGYFLRDGQLVYTPAEGEAGYAPLTRVADGEDRRDEDGPVQVRGVTPEQITARAGHEFWCYQEGEKTGKTHALFPLISARTALADLSLLPHVRTMRGVTHTPLVRKDGSVLDTPGYDRATGLYFLPIDGLEVIPVPDEPTGEDVTAAVALLDEVVWDFPFRSKDHRANFLGMLMTPLLREMCPPPYKIAIFDAPQSRSGKTLLSKVARTLHGGVVRASVPTDEAEWSKTISTILNITTAPIVTFDNVRGEVTSGVLDSLLTESRFDARQLGSTNELIQRANDRFWSLTSNNAKLGGDLVKRALWISINPEQSNPENRTGFRHPDLTTWVAGHRAELLAALLTLVRAWVVAGRPAPSQPGTDIYVGWISTVRAVLEHAGVPGVFDRPESKRQAVSDEETDWVTFLSAVVRVFDDQPWTARQLLDAVDKTAGLLESVETIHLDELPGKLGEKYHSGSDISKSLGRFLGFKADAWQSGYMVERFDTFGGKKAVRWVVRTERVGNETDKPGPSDQNASKEPPEVGGLGFEGVSCNACVDQNTTFKLCSHVITGDKSSDVRRGGLGGNPLKPQTPDPRRPAAIDLPCTDCSAPVGRSCPGVPAEPVGEFDGMCDARADAWVTALNAWSGYQPGDEVTEDLFFD